MYKSLISFNHQGILYRNIICIVCLLLVCLQGRAQTYWENYELLTTKQGLPHNIVLSLLQDKEGYMWVGTYNGLSRYDGHSFKTYKDVFGPTQSNNWFHAIEAMYEDRDGNIWAGSRGGLVSRFDKRQQRFIVCRQQPGANRVQCFAQDNRGRVWVGYQNGVAGIVQGDSIMQLLNAGSSIVAIAEAVDNSWLIFAAEGMFTFSNAGLKPFTVNGMPADLSISSIYSARKIGQYWFVYIGNMCLVVDIEQKTVVKTITPPSNSRIIYKQTGLYNKGYMIVEAFLLRTYDKSGKPIDSIDISRNAWNNNHEIHNALLQDRTGIVWLGTNSGLYKIDPAKYRFQKYARNNITYPLGDNYVRTIYAAGNELWTGTKDGRINRLEYNAAEDNYVLKDTYLLHTEGRVDRLYTINAILSYNGMILAGGEGGRIFALKKGNDFFEEYGKVDIKNAWQGIWKLFADKAGNIWIGTNKAGMYVWEAATGKLHQYNDTIKGQGRLHAKSVWNIYEDKNKTLWLGTDNGLFIVENTGDVSNLHIRDFKLKVADDQQVNVWHMAEDSFGNLWLGTTGHGLFQLTAGRDKYISYRNRPNNVICGLVTDSMDGLWISTVNGLYRYDIAKMHFAGYDEQDGLLSNEFNFKAVAKTPGGMLFWGNKTGMIGFRPEKLSHPLNTNIPVCISAVEIAGGDSTAALYTAQPAELSYKQNFIDLHFAIPDFSKPLSHRYRYRLEGFENQWRETRAAQPSATYTNLPPGNYRFVVYGAADGIHRSSSPAVFSFTIRPAFWQTIVFRVAVAALLFFTGVWLVYKRIQAVVKREREKHRIEKEIASLELRALQAQMNPHFIFNAIHSIQHFILHNDVLAANDYLSRFAKLMRLFLESSKNRYISLSNEIELLQLYLQLEQLRFDDKFSFGIDVDGTIDMYKVNIPPALIQPFVENAVNHGLVYHKGKGRLQISFERAGKDKIKCIIDDDGIGRKAAAVIKAQQSKKHVSRGMQLIEERVKTYNFIDEQDIDIHITDKNYPQQGTRVEITIPIGPIQ